MEKVTYYALGLISGIIIGGILVTIY